MSQDELMARIDEIIDECDNEKVKEKRERKRETIEKTHDVQAIPEEEFDMLMKAGIVFMGILLVLGTVFLIFHMAIWSIIFSGSSILVGGFVWAARQIPGLKEPRWIDVLDTREMKKMNKFLKEYGLKIEETEEHYFLDTEVKRIVEL